MILPIPPLPLHPTPGPTLPPGAEPGRVGEQFESLFLSMLLKPIESSSSFFGDGPEGRTFSGLFRQQLADQLAASRPLGIADRIEKVLKDRLDAAKELAQNIVPAELTERQGDEPNRS